MHEKRPSCRSPARLLYGVLPLLMLVNVRAGAITIGAGPVLTNSVGTTADKRGDAWYEEFQDWAREDVRALDANSDQYLFNNTEDTARDMIAFYSHDDGSNVFFRVDLFDLGYGSETGGVDVYVAIDCAPGGQTWFPDFTDTQTDHPWEVCVAVYDSVNRQVYDSAFGSHAGDFLGNYWRSDLDGVEFGIKRSLLLAQGWDGSSPLNLQPFTTRDLTDGGPGEIAGSDLVDHFGTLTRDVGDGTGLLAGAVPSDATTGRAKYAVIAHANQSVATKSGTQAHIYTDRSDINLHPGFVRLLDSAEMLKTPINLHISGTLLTSFLWANQDPAEPGYPDRDGPAFLRRVSNFVTNGPGSLIGGVLAEHIMPYFEGEVNAKSLEQNAELIDHLFGLSEEEMKVMHVPERVIRSNTNNLHTGQTGPLDGKTFEEIEQSGYVATYLDEVTHLHWWFYPGETNNPGWDENNCGRWAGGRGNDEETYHHKVHKVNGVYCFMINDREDQSKFGNDDGGMALDTRFTLLDKARQSDSSQLTLVFDDWEAYAGNSFASSTPNNNADQFHNTLRWAANHQWIELVNLRDVVEWATNDASWVVDHGAVYDKSTQTYEWLKRASEHSYDNWYYGSGQEESFFDRVPVVHWDGSAFTPAGMKKYGDMNTPGTLIRDTWDTISQITATNLRRNAEWSFSAMIYETAWHDEDANPDQYKSRNYQTSFNRGVADGNCDESFEDTTHDDTAGWALRLHGHARDLGVMKDASDWVANIKSGFQGAGTFVYDRDVDDDRLDEYILCNNRVYLCFERWGARLVKAFVYDPDLNGGDAREVIGAPMTNPAEEHENEGADNNRCSAFKDRYSFGHGDNRYVDMDFAFTAPAAGVNSWTFTSKDGEIVKRVVLEDGRDVAVAEYTLQPAVGNLETRFGLGPNQMDLVLNGPAHLVALSDPTYRGLRNTQGGEAYVVVGHNCGFNNSPVNTGWENRELPLIEQVETAGSSTNFSVALAFSQASAADLDGDGLSNTNEMALGTNHEKADSDDDRIPDGWEVAEGLNPLVPDATAHGDNDGYDNWQEYVADTEPTNGLSYFRAWRITRSSPVRIYFVASTNRLYTLQAAEDPASGGWTNVPAQTDLRFPAGGTNWLTDATDTNARAYRIRVHLP